MLSTHEVPIVKVHLTLHPNADSLSIVNIDGYTVCVRTEDWEDGQLGAYIPPDSLVQTDRPEFSFLKREGRDVERIRVIKLRGVISMGLLIPAPPDCSVGDNVADLLEVEHYEPEMQLLQGDAIPGPHLFVPKYDVDTIRKYHRLLVDGETVYVFEKMNGANARYLFYDEKMWIGSRNQWKDSGSQWHTALEGCPQIEEFCRANQGVTLYGEVYGQVGGFKYGNGGIRFAAFDILRDGSFIDITEFTYLCGQYGIPIAPLLYIGPYSLSKIEELAEGQSIISGANHIKEGCVVRPEKERTHPKLGRVVLKCVSNAYYMSKHS